MRLAELLSDLTSLRACDPAAAMALVSHRPTDNAQSVNGLGDKDVDLKRAKDLIELHSTVKLAYQDGIDRELLRAREEVERVLAGL